MFSKLACSSLVIAACTLVACSDSTETPGGSPSAAAGEFSFTATMPSAPAGSKVVVIWSVTSGADSIHAFGSGSTSGSDVFVSFSTTPSSELLNEGRLGVGVVGLVAADTEMAEGRITSAELESKLIAIAGDYAVVYRTDVEIPATSTHWATSFPKGFACGRCQPRQGEAEFDTFSPTDCSAVQLSPYSKDVRWCDWT